MALVDLAGAAKAIKKLSPADKAAKIGAGAAARGRLNKKESDIGLPDFLQKKADAFKKRVKPL